ncbi:MAG TPA: ATP-dependent zinc metalloprotease FtsH [Polyangia bacterium]|nr:ATP-dependent zinc metalloprotease FtsH [Polyangia bacterium]
MPDSPKPRAPADRPSRRAWALYVLLGLFAAMLLARPQSAGTRIPYSEFKQRVAAGQISEVELSKERVRATPSDEAAKKRGERWVALRVDDPDLVKQLEAKHITISGAPDGDWFSSLFMVWLLPMVLLGGFWLLVLRRMRPGAGVMSIGRSRAKLVAEEGTGVTFADVAGVDEAVDEVREIVDFLSSPEKFRAVGARIPKGVLLVGPPGTGKTLLARAIAGEAKVPFFSLTGSDFVEMFVGVGAARVRDLFMQAQAKAPCIVFIDELDAVGKSRGPGNLAGHDEREQTLNQLLAEMDGFDARKGLMIIAATNRPETLDSALMRPGRFDRQVLVDRPDVKGRLAILQVHAKGVRFAPDVDLRKVASLTPGMVGADLANLINEAALLAARHGRLDVTTVEVNEAIERTLAGLEKKNRLLNPREKEIVAHHESGHALLAEILPSTDRVHKVSMIPRGLGALGFTMQLPLEDRYLMSRPELLDKITVLMGGRAAEKLVFGEISTGASDDLQRATDLARRMVTQFGMSTLLGPVSLTRLDGAMESRFLPGVTFGGEKGYSERTQQVIDSEIGDLLRGSFERATALLEHNRKQLLDLAARLRDKEVLEGPELREVLAGAELPPDEHQPAEGAPLSAHH